LEKNVLVWYCRKQDIYPSKMSYVNLETEKTWSRWHLSMEE